MPDILEQLIVYGLLVCAIIVLAIVIIPGLLASSRTAVQDDDEQELCRGCGYDVRKLLRCPECGRPTPEARRQHLTNLRNDWPTETIAPRVPDPHEAPVVILTTDDSWAGRLLKDHLEARGISANLNEVQGISLAAYTVGRSSYRLTVWSDDQQRAAAIVKHLWPEELRAK